MTQLLDPASRVATEPGAARTTGTSTEATRGARDRSDPPAPRLWPAFTGAFVLYLVAGWQLAIVHHAIVGDAMARVANASYVLSSRDQHLAAIGFVWNPLPSLAALPILPFSRWFPALRTEAFAGNIVSAGFMAAAVALVWRSLRELRVEPWIAAALTLLFAVHPMILEYGANGDSEATLVCFLALACLGLLRWLELRDLASLLMLGTALGLGYLGRQEFLAAGAASLALILVVTFRGEAGTARHRRWAALTEAMLAGLPFVFAIVCWAGSAFLIVGTATSYLSVNAEQVGAGAGGIATVVGGTGAVDRAAYFLGQLLVLEPVWSITLLVAGALAWRRRDARILAPLCTFGAVLVTQGALFTTGSTFGWLRFAITVVPLTVLAAGIALAPRRVPGSAGVGRPARSAQRRGHGALAGLVVLACGVAAIPVAVHGMTTPRWGREEATSVHLLPGYGWAPVAASAYRPHWLDDYDRLARYFDAQHLPSGSVLTDVQYTFPLVLKSARPHQFVIPSDFDFERSVSDPSTFKVRYLLISDGPADVLRSSYPVIGTGHRRHLAIGPLVRTFRAGPQRLSLYRVARSVTEQRG